MIEGLNTGTADASSRKQINGHSVSHKRSHPLITATAPLMNLSTAPAMRLCHFPDQRAQKKEKEATVNRNMTPLKR